MMIVDVSEETNQKSSASKRFSRLQVPIEIREKLIIPLDDCFQGKKLNATKSFAQVTLDHLVCSNKP